MNFVWETDEGEAGEIILWYLFFGVLQLCSIFRKLGPLNPKTQVNYVII